MAFTGPIEDRLAIRERYGTYSDSSFRKDVEAWLECWTSDGVRAQGQAEASGVEGLRRFWDRAWAAMERMAFFAEVAAIEVEGDRATARAYCREILALKTGGIRKVVGVYDDVLVRDTGVWRFARRQYTLFMDEGA
jgi:ketosteroid isomerase-like protein